MTKAECVRWCKSHGVTIKVEGTKATGQSVFGVAPEGKYWVATGTTVVGAGGFARGESIDWREIHDALADDAQYGFADAEEAHAAR